MSFRSTLYVGSVSHHRTKPRQHRFRYRMFWLLLDIDEIDALNEGLRLFSHARFNAVSFYETDHGNGNAEGLRAQVERQIRAAGIATKVDAIRLLCMPRIFGYGFNPLSVFYCYDGDGGLIALLYEVHNTFGERHIYVFPVASSDAHATSMICAKCLYVSPFLDMNMNYEFWATQPGSRLSLSIRGTDDEGLLISAALIGKRRPLSDGALIELLFSHPFLTVMVTGRIHWHALRLWWKGIAVRPHSPASAPPVTFPRADKSIRHGQ